MDAIKLSKSQARKIILHAAALDKPAPFGLGIQAVYNLIDHLGYVQIDTNYVVERAHHHAIFSRVPDYRPEWLGELQEDGRISEFLMADSGFMPMNEYRFSLPVQASMGQRHQPKTPEENRVMKQVLDRIGREGPLMVTDFENDRHQPSSGWWDWRPAKIALERLYFSGQLLATRTKAFKKLYDLPENIVHTDIYTNIPTPEQYARHVINRTLQVLGIAGSKEMAWRARFVKDNLVKKMLPQLAAAGEIIPVTIEGVKNQQYTLPAYATKEIDLSGDVWILSPFDNLNVFRHRLRDFFDFDYQIECFVPEPKRKYGYFSLPVLLSDRFIARMDAKADRKKRILMVHNLHFESVKLNQTEIEHFVEALKAFVVFNNCRDVALTRSNNEEYLNQIKVLMG